MPGVLYRLPVGRYYLKKWLQESFFSSASFLSTLQMSSTLPKYVFLFFLDRCSGVEFDSGEEVDGWGGIKRGGTES